MTLSQRGWVIGLSVLAGSGWLLTQAYPSELGFPFAGCIHFALIAFSGLLVAARNGWERWPQRSWAGMATAGICIFVLPGTVLELTAGGISSFTSVALFCAIPVVVVLGAKFFGEEESRSNLLWPALVGLLGALLLFPVQIPGSMRRIVCFAAVTVSCVIVGMTSVWMHHLLRGLRVAQAVVVVAVAGTLVLGVYGMTAGWPRVGAALIGGEAARCAVFDLPLVWLLVWLMRDVDPERLSARFLIAPLITAAEGYAIERGPLTAGNIVALALMAAGAAMLLLKEEAQEPPGLGLQQHFSTGG